MPNLYWKVRLYRLDGMYCHCEVTTSTHDLCEIDTIKDFYHSLTGSKLILEGMSETSFGLKQPVEAFTSLYLNKP